MANFELTARICKYLDRHLTFPLLEFLWEKQVSFTFTMGCSGGGTSANFLIEHIVGFNNFLPMMVIKAQICYESYLHTVPDKIVL